LVGEGTSILTGIVLVYSLASVTNPTNWIQEKGIWEGNLGFEEGQKQGVRDVDDSSALNSSIATQLSRFWTYSPHALPALAGLS
jgi:hypothetical protein